MGYKWRWTSYGLILAVISAGLLVGAAFTDGWVSNMMIGVAIIIAILAYIRTYRNIGRKH